MTNAGIPEMSFGTNISFGGNVNLTGSYMGQEMFNTENIDRSNAEQVVDKELAQVRQDYGQAWTYNSGKASFNFFPQMGDQVMNPLNGFWEKSIDVLAGGRTYGNHYVDWNGKISWIKPITGIAPTPGKGFRGGSIKIRDGYLKSLPKEFQRWFHRYWKDPSAPNASNSEINEALKLWKSNGKPKIK